MITQVAERMFREAIKDSKKLIKPKPTPKIQPRVRERRHIIMTPTEAVLKIKELGVSITRRTLLTYEKMGFVGEAKRGSNGRKGKYTDYPDDTPVRAYAAWKIINDKDLGINVSPEKLEGLIKYDFENDQHMKLIKEDIENLGHLFSSGNIEYKELAERLKKITERAKDERIINIYYSLLEGVREKRSNDEIMRQAKEINTSYIEAWSSKP